VTADLNPRYTFDTLVVGAGNRLAVAAARSVADHPATAHNPLFVYSDTGLGKTHLLMAIGQAARQLSPSLVVEYVTLDEFVEAYHAAVSAGDTDAFHERYKSAGVLLIDDVQFLAHRRELQTELLRFTAELQEAGSQVVLSSDRPPSEIADLDDRLLATLAGGLVIDIGPPDLETRLAILNRRADERGVELGRDVLRVVAEGETTNVRELLGVLNRLIAFQAVSEHPLTPEAARALLDGGAEGGARRGSMPPGPEPPDLEVLPDLPEGIVVADPEPEPPPVVIDSSAGMGQADDTGDEFGLFLSEVTRTVEEQMDRWQGRVRDAINHWSAKGYRTDRLERLLERGAEDPDATIRAFERDIATLRTLQHQMAECDPERAGDPVFRDPEALAEAEEAVQRAEATFEPPPAPSEAFALRDFVESGSTRVALQAAKTIIEEPGVQYNPLVLVGPSGIGKTHLLHGIGRELARGRPVGWVACVSAQSFMDELVQAIDDNRIPTWRARYRRAHAFLLDNVDLLGASDRAQDELFFLFNALLEADRQLVFTSTLPPREVNGLNDRLVSRLEGGLVAGLDVPDETLRRDVLVRQFMARVGRADEELVSYLAHQPVESVRSLLGLAQKILTTADAKGAAPSVGIAREVLEGPAAAGRPARTSGVVVAPSGGVESREKVVWDWPNPADRIIEDLG